MKRHRWIVVLAIATASYTTSYEALGQPYLDTCNQDYSPPCILGNDEEYGLGGEGVVGQTSDGTGVLGIDTNGGVGVAGSSISESGNGIGVQGSSYTSYGVFASSVGATAIYGGGYGGGGSFVGQRGPGVVGQTAYEYLAGVVGQNTSSTGGVGVLGMATTTTCIGLTPSGVSGCSTLSDGVGVYGTSTSYYGVYGNSSSGTGVYGTNANSNSGSAAIYGDSTGTSGTGVFGVALGSGGYGVQGSGGAYGVYGSSTSGAGLYGNSTSGQGMYGVSNSSDGIYGLTSGTGGSTAGVYGNGPANGVLGWCTGTACAGVSGQTNVSNSTGIYGDGSGSGGYGVYGTGAAFGVYGTCTGGGGCLAGKFQGAVTITGALTVGSCSGCTSDVRLKKNVEPLGGAIDQLLRLKGVTFEWKDPAEHDNDTRTQSGFIAQDVEKAFPGWVKDDGYTAPDGQKYKTLELRQIEALEVESIRTLKTENDELRAHLVLLEQRLDTLTNGRDPISRGPGFGKGTLSLCGLGIAGAAGLLLFRRKRTEEQS